MLQRPGPRRAKRVNEPPNKALERWWMRARWGGGQKSLKGRIKPPAVHHCVPILDPAEKILVNHALERCTQVVQHFKGVLLGWRLDQNRKIAPKPRFVVKVFMYGCAGGADVRLCNVLEICVDELGPEVRGLEVISVAAI